MTMQYFRAQGENMMQKYVPNPTILGMIIIVKVIKKIITSALTVHLGKKKGHDQGVAKLVLEEG